VSQPFAEVAEAFSRTAEKYDHFAEDHPHLSRLRLRIYNHLIPHLKPGASILELNAGTGIDAVYLAQQGFRVHATDIAPGMLQRLRDKVESLDLQDRVTLQLVSFTELEKVQGGPFDAVFSNLGGLNCIPDLSPVVHSLPALLRPGGLVTWVLMPRVCLWELALVFRGDFKVAFRRLARGGTRSHLEGMHFMIYYFTPSQALSAFGKQFIPLDLEGLCVFAPPAESKNLARQHPRLYRWLSWLDDRLASRAPFHGWGDFFVITLRYSPSQP